MNVTSSRTLVSRSALALFLTGGLLSALVVAGPLDPPAGPVAPTYKTLGDVEPRTAINATNTPGDADSLFKITRPGSYYLTGSITGVVGKHGIEIAASGVTVDLNGFDLVGVPDMGEFDGVTHTVPNLTNIAVLNGSVRTWGGEGIDLGSLNVTGGRVDGVRTSGNTSTGIFTGSGFTISNCLATSNLSNGFGVNHGCTVTNCAASTNLGVGIAAGDGCTITDCSASTNDGGGISVLVGGKLTNCTATGNQSNGMGIGQGASVTNSTASRNLGNGIAAGADCTIIGCMTFLNGANGISAAIGGTVTDCAAASNTLNGVITGNTCTITGCTAYFSNLSGISTGTGSTVADCTAFANSLDGIVCASACVIRGAACSFNGNGGTGAGIRATGSGNRIQDNNCVAADRGIAVDLAGNIIIKNTCSGNSVNWVIAANNFYGPIIDRTGVTTAAVNGAAAAGTLVSTDPNANFTY